jgi:hypothetical protein
LKRDLSIECWTPEHNRMSTLIGLPIIIVWLVIFPVGIFLKLFLNRKNLNDREIYVTYGLFFLGIEDHAFYWEIVISNIKKFVFILCTTVMGSILPE